ncbi:NAD-dependent epimerase/dehydratase family protein [Yersinia pseudotuberculosis]|uniref:NAD-dependent epimerase/dehydratase family protein n=1 Tax=Yersinia pseudotuberculosis TaxID=633 RepID=UPI001A9D6AFA|nr:NAD-dependent epimerase/dehydratase family protein [Yersinia pseudotuberculosis]MBO1550553.1 NAD-dependent epimerase/dehydratase family protein [Yersinia pseudotuberculosis]MBO1570569.1 NAD-dependent epimerase/dehydratase family protein [Yersinia pseudotuberculosis]MBO1585676.1 NAD-dependent epimerase/dehydratase family protein [Yersinia pseudotuberculosis]MBO1634999.1 NAD-dependent epimerase/dehydratase family protein [Yersinia pseudotuberculosis]
MKLAIFGATSQIAKDLIIRLSGLQDIKLYLYSRNPVLVEEWASKLRSRNKINSYHFAEFCSNQQYDGIINFIGASDPEKIKLINSDILKITNEYDSIIINYLNVHIECKYLFISSGAAYGDVFSTENHDRTYSKFKLDNQSVSDWYGIAKYCTEMRHRSLYQFNIYDIRVFSYFSASQNIEANFILSEMYRRIRDNSIFYTTDQNIVRDFIHPDDFYQLVCSVLFNDIKSCVLDCYSAEPITKKELILLMHDEFGMEYNIKKNSKLISTSASKVFYYSKNKSAGGLLGYIPRYTSKESIVMEMSKIIKNIKHHD